LILGFEAIGEISKFCTFLGILEHCKDHKDVFCALDPDFKLNLSAKLFVPC
jgi:hypothetical protein